MLHRLLPLRGLCQELMIPQCFPSPAYTDSQSTIFVGNSAASARLSVWLNRRSAVLREGVDCKEICLAKVSDGDNCANYFTKPITTKSMMRYFSYTHGQPQRILSTKHAVQVLAHNIQPCPALCGTPIEYGYTCTPLPPEDSDAEPAPTSAPESAPASAPEPAPIAAPASAQENGHSKCWCTFCGHNPRDGCLNVGLRAQNYLCNNCYRGCICFCDDPRQTDDDTEDFNSD